MNILYTKLIYGKLAELMLSQDHLVIVKYDETVMSEAGGRCCNRDYNYQKRI